MIMKRILFIALAFVACITCRAQVITTVAGNGTAGYSGDGGAATAAELKAPAGVAIDASGNVYIADQQNNCIRKMFASGIITTIAGNGIIGYSGDGGAATDAMLFLPAGVAVDVSGNVFIADYGNNVIRKVNTSGIISIFAGNDTAGYNGDGGAATAAELWGPQAVATDRSGNVYISDSWNNRVRKVNTSGIITNFVGNSCGLYAGDGSVATASGVINPQGLAIDAEGNVYIADEGNVRVEKVDTLGIITTIAGNGDSGFTGDDGMATAAKLYNPSGVAIDSIGNIYILDQTNVRVRKVNRYGTISTVAGNGTYGFSGDGGAATAGQFSSVSLAVDGGGNIYIADGGNNRIRKVTCCPEDIKNIDTKSESIKAYPDPTSNILHIQSPVIIQHVAVYNLMGQIVYETKSSATEMDINTEHLPAGMYLLKVNDTWVQRFVKE